MRKLVSCVLLSAACSATSQDAQVAAIQAGPGIKVDGATHTVSVDESTVPAGLDCATGALVRRGASGWECVGTAPDASALGGRPAAAYLTADGTAANASRLGGWPASAYVTSGWGVANDSARLGGLAASSYLTAAAGTASDSARFGGHAPSEFVQTTLQSDIEAGTHRQVFSFADAGGATARISADGLYCGATAAVGATFSAFDPATRRSAIGYRAAKLLCEQADGCAAPTAHMCSASEMIRSAQIGAFGTVDQNGAWISTGAAQPASNSAGLLADCNGWTNSSSSARATAWHVVGGSGAGFEASCDSTLPILCCR
jgi:hypothetical protein